MSKAHVDDLQNALESNHWKIVGQEPGNGYDIAVIWVIARPDGSNRLHLVFELSIGLKETFEKSIEQSIGCELREMPRVSLYFARINRSWPRKLSAFIEDLNAVSPD